MLFSSVLFCQMFLMLRTWNQQQGQFLDSKSQSNFLLPEKALRVTLVSSPKDLPYIIFHPPFTLHASFLSLRNHTELSADSSVNDTATCMWGTSRGARSNQIKSLQSISCNTPSKQLWSKGSSTNYRTWEHTAGQQSTKQLAGDRLVCSLVE